MVWVRPPAALRLATISARIASTAPSRPFGAPQARPDWAALAALTASPGRTGGLPPPSPPPTVRGPPRGILLKQPTCACRVPAVVPSAARLFPAAGPRL